MSKDRCFTEHNIVLYCMILLYTAWYCYILHDIVIYCMILLYTVWYCYILYDIVLYCMILFYTTWYCSLLHDIVLYCWYYSIMYCINFYWIVWYVRRTYVIIKLRKTKKYFPRNKFEMKRSIKKHFCMTFNFKPPLVESRIAERWTFWWRN